MVSARFSAYLQAHGAEFGYTPEEVAATNITINTLATYFLMLQVAMEHSGSAETARDLRKTIDRELWDFGLLIEPWTTLLDLEFTTEGLSDLELDDHVGGFLSRYGDEKRLNAQYQSVVVDYLTFLLEQGREITEDDATLAAVLASWKGIALIAGRPLDDLHEEALVLLRQVDCDCEPWHLLIDREFLTMLE